MTATNTSAKGAVRDITYHEGPASENNDVGINYRQFTCKTDDELVAGNQISVVFTVDRPAKDVWPYLKDFNLWQNSYGYYYSGVVGELYTDVDLGLGGLTFHIDVRKPNEPAWEYPYHYVVLRVVPERLIVLFQPIPKDGTTGGLSPGFHVFMLHERDGRTIVSVYMEHATRTRNIAQEEALRPWRELAPQAEKFWREIFIPNLKRLVCGGD